MSAETLPALPAKEPAAAAAERMALDSMLAKHADFQFNKEAEALALSAEIEAKAGVCVCGVGGRVGFFFVSRLT